MGENTKIEWADHTFNPVIGCQEVSPACDHCYARVQNEHRQWVKGWGPDGERKRTSAGNWTKPLAWNKTAQRLGVRYRVFCASLSDVFDNKWAPEIRRELFELIAATPNLDWLLLTKRPQNMARMLPKDWSAEHYRNVWLGTTVENQEEAQRRVPRLIEIPAVVHFLSCEPLLGPLDIREWCTRREPERQKGTDWDWMGVNWVICGGESGGRVARPLHPQWARSLRDQCKDAGVPFFFKQWGESAPYGHPGMPGARSYSEIMALDEHTTMVRCGKKTAGRTLDGAIYSEFPTGEV